MRVLGLAVLIVMSTGPAARAETVNFNGTVDAVCALSAATDGTLAISTGGDQISSTESGGTSGSITILSIGSNTIDVAAPTRTSEPVDYDPTGESVEVAYQGLGGLSLITQAFTNQATNFAVGVIAASVLTVDNRITNPNGFAAGNYGTQTVITCRP